MEYITRTRKEMRSQGSNAPLPNCFLPTRFVLHIYWIRSILVTQRGWSLEELLISGIIPQINGTEWMTHWAY